MAIFKGAGVAIVTPMKENEEVNYVQVGGTWSNGRLSRERMRL